MIAGADESRGALLLALRGAGVRDLAVLRAIETVPREDFLPHRLRDLGARNIAVPIGCGQTMPPPLSLALMLEALGARADDRVLEVGTGSGYATAILSRLAREVVSFERYRTLATEAEGRLRERGHAVRVVVGDGLVFPAEFGRFDRVVVHARIAAVPRSVVEALNAGGRVVAGVDAEGDEPASLAVFDRAPEGSAEEFTCRRVAPMRFAPAQRGIARAL